MSDARGITLDYSAPFQRALELIGKRWTGAVIRGLLSRPARFNQLLTGIPGISDRVLTERLRELEEGLAERLVDIGPPVRGMPVRLTDRSDGVPARRKCTTDFKIRVIARWLREQGATAERPATVCLGISMDEMERARSPEASGFPFERLAYPLLDLRLYRDGCEALIRGAGLALPRARTSRAGDGGNRPPEIAAGASAWTARPDRSTPVAGGRL